MTKVYGMWIVKNGHVTPGPRFFASMRAACDSLFVILPSPCHATLREQCRVQVIECVWPKAEIHVHAADGDDMYAIFVREFEVLG